MPLTSREENILDKNREVIVDVLTDLMQVVEQLYLHGVLNEIQKNRIKSSSPITNNGEMLVDMVRRRSIKDFQTVSRCLRSMRQGLIADILEGGGQWMI